MASTKCDSMDREAAAFSFKRPSPVARCPAIGDRQRRFPHSGGGKSENTGGRRGSGGGGSQKDRRRVPSASDLRRNPQSWTKYSLADVTTDQLSDRSNTSAALDFLKQLRKRSAAAAAEKNSAMDMEEDEEVPADLSQPITFRKPPTTSSSSRPKRSAAVRKTPAATMDEDDLVMAVDVEEEKAAVVAADLGQPIFFRKPPQTKSTSRPNKFRRTSVIVPEFSEEPAEGDTSAVVCQKEEETMAESTATTTSTALVSSRPIELPSGASGGEDKKVTKSVTGKSASGAIKLSHLADEEDD